MPVPNSWSKSEVEAAVADYFDMLRCELKGQKYNKTAHRRILREQLHNRSDGSVELKHQNISAVLIEMGIPYIDGYKPRSNYQRALLPAAISAYLKDNAEFHELFQDNSKAAPRVPAIDNVLEAMVDPPPLPDHHTSTAVEASATCNPAGVNYLEREAQNQSLGDAGEKFVISYERARLIHAGKHSLADRIERVSVSEGPSAGFDVRSFEENGTDRFIEAKTTKYGKNTPFFVTPNELRFSKTNASRYFLYRLFLFGTDPKMFALQGYLRDRCVLEASQFVARSV